MSDIYITAGILGFLLRVSYRVLRPQTAGAELGNPIYARINSIVTIGCVAFVTISLIKATTAAGYLPLLYSALALGVGAGAERVLLEGEGSLRCIIKSIFGILSGVWSVLTLIGVSNLL